MPQVNSIDACVPFKGQIFDNDNHAYEFYCLFVKKKGLFIRRNHVYKSCKNKSEENSLGVHKREFVCDCGGIVKQRKVSNEERKRNRKFSRHNCGTKMLVTKSTIEFEEKWVVKYFNNFHNHELLDDKKV